MAGTPHDFMKKFPLSPHHEISETFADMMGLTVFNGQTLRLEFAVARMDEPKPPAQPTGERHIVSRLVLSAECTIDLINQMHQISQQLLQLGLIKMEQGRATPQAKPH